MDAGLDVEVVTVMAVSAGRRGIRPTDCRPAKIKLYRVSQEECARLRDSVPYVKLYRYNPKHLYPTVTEIMAREV